MFTFSCDVIVLEMDFFVMFHEPGGSKRTLKTTGTGIECHRHTAQGGHGSHAVWVPRDHGHSVRGVHGDSCKAARGGACTENQTWRDSKRTL